jgi:hypothetical protein
MPRVMLTLLVLMNLTVVCQGHDHDEQRTSLHLSLLGEPHGDAMPMSHVGLLIDGTGSVCLPTEKPGAYNEPPHDVPALAGERTAPEVTPAHTEAHSSFVLGAGLLAVALLVITSRRTAHTASWPGLHSEAKPAPPVPPPRSATAVP